MLWLSQDQQRTVFLDHFILAPCRMLSLNCTLVMPYVFTKGQSKKEPVILLHLLYGYQSHIIQGLLCQDTWEKQFSDLKLRTKNNCTSPNTHFLTLNPLTVLTLYFIFSFLPLFSLCPNFFTTFDVSIMCIF